jgi:lipoprotein-anchoring transpeptidase ErfK/SrfK
MTLLVSALKLSVTTVVVSSVLSSCVATPPGPPPKAEHVLYEWYDDGGPGEVKVKINLNTQQAYYTRGGRDIGWSYVATGKEGHGTPSGTYRITEKLEEKYSGSYGWIEDEFGNVTNGDAKPSTKVPAGQKYMPAPMPYWQRITGYGIGMHAGVIPKPGETASHGCIRLPKDFAPMLFSVTKVGTPVTIEH